MPSLENADGTLKESGDKAVRWFGPIECHHRRDGWRCQSGIQRIFLFGSDLTAEDPLGVVKRRGSAESGMGWNAIGRKNNRRDGETWANATSKTLQITRF